MSNATTDLTPLEWLRQRARQKKDDLWLGVEGKKMLRKAAHALEDEEQHTAAAQAMYSSAAGERDAALAENKRLADALEAAQRTAKEAIEGQAREAVRQLGNVEAAVARAEVAEARNTRLEILGTELAARLGAEDMNRVQEASASALSIQERLEAAEVAPEYVRETNHQAVELTGVLQGKLAAAEAQYQQSIKERVHLRAAFSAAEAQVAALRDLADLWMKQQAQYPVETDPRAVGAAAAVQCCVQELRAALAAQPTTPLHANGCEFVTDRGWRCVTGCPTTEWVRNNPGDGGQAAAQPTPPETDGFPWGSKCPHLNIQHHSTTACRLPLGHTGPHAYGASVTACD